jgi:hypothetical protein
VIVAIAGIVLAAIAAIATAWQGYLLYRQLRHTETVNKAILYQNVAHQFIDLDRVLLENPLLRPYFYSGKPLPRRRRTRGRVLSFAEFFADTAECCIASEAVLSHLAGDWDDFFHLVYENSPALRFYWKQSGHLYPARVHRAFTEERSRSSRT